MISQYSRAHLTSSLRNLNFSTIINQIRNQNLVQSLLKSPKPRIVQLVRSMAGTSHPANRLAKEESPYLLQHAHNPVDWYPWGEEAFAAARDRDCPIFLSIGYSTCHWCHVMERESFESEEIAAILNRSFIPVKVDREERPDVDKTYMTYIQATQGSGGWPMSVFLTPELSPFFGGTYFPPKDAYGRPGFPTVLSRIASVYEQRKAEIKSSSADAMRQLTEILASGGGEKGAPPPGECAIEACAAALAGRFDPLLGGFGKAPKFPRPAEINLMLAQYARQAAAGQEAAASETLRMATFTLEKMAAGGMRDQLGGGFHRYSVDEYWHVPHFEIMLYDAPQLVSAYLSAFQITKDLRFAAVARGVLEYLLRDLRHPGGAFYAAEDADSLDPVDGKKKEGEFYVWAAEEVQRVLGAQRAQRFLSYYGCKPEGNCTLSPRSDPHGEFTGKNVLIQTHSVESVAAAAGLSVGEFEEELAASREELFNVRARRPRPHRDDKIVTAWNGMTIGALATAGRVLAAEDPPLERLFPVEGRRPEEYIAAAAEAAAFLRTNLYDEDTKRLRRCYTRGPSPVAAFSDDYALLIGGLLDLYAASGELEWLRWAEDLQATLDADFWDEKNGGYFQAPAGDVHLKLRMKEDYDGAEPAASSIAAANLWRLAALAGADRGEALRAQAQRCAGAFAGQLESAPLALPQMCCALHLLGLGHARQVIVAGKRGADDTNALLDAIFSAYAPDKAVIHLDFGEEGTVEFWRQHNPYAVSMVEGAGAAPGGPATAYICQNFTCRKPATDAAVVERAMKEHAGGAGAKPVPVDLDLPPPKREV